MLLTVLRTLIMYFVIIAAIRLMGKRQIGDMQPTEHVITILMSEIAAIPIQDIEIPIIYGILATGTLVILEIITSFVAMKSINFRRIIYGRSAVIIENGNIDQKMLKKLRMTVPDLMEVLRNQEVFDLNEVAYAILETNGQMSVLLKPQFQTASVSDLKGHSQPTTMPCLIVSDGKLLTKAMKKYGVTKEKVYCEVKNNHIKLKNVFLMTIDQNGKTTIVKKEKQE
ncbi:MAG: DUF421 domain-containing protein [Clostridia bacterium]|nr:DUF421 domain-containing protein [Clostridia bacterium]